MPSSPMTSWKSTNFCVNYMYSLHMSFLKFFSNCLYIWKNSSSWGPSLFVDIIPSPLHVFIFLFHLFFCTYFHHQFYIIIKSIFLFPHLRSGVLRPWKRLSVSELLTSSLACSSSFSFLSPRVLNSSNALARSSGLTLLLLILLTAALPNLPACQRIISLSDTFCKGTWLLD